MRHAFIALILTAGPAFAAERTHDVTPADYFTLATITEIAVSPDGQHVAYTLATWDKADDSRKTDLWVVGIRLGSKPQRLTFDRANDRHPKWSADGETIYFVGNRKRAGEKTPYDGTAQVWRIKRDGEEPRAVTNVSGGIDDFDYAPKAGAVFYSVDTTATDDDEFSSLRAKYPAEYGHGSRKVSEIHRLDSATWRSERLVAEKRYIREFAVTRDGQRIAMVSAFDDSVVKSEGESRVDIWENGKVITPPTDVYRKNAHSPHAWLESLEWSPDGDKFAFCSIFDAYPAEVVIGTKAESGWNMKLMSRKLPPFEVRGYGSPLRWTTHGELEYLAERAGRVPVVVYDPGQDTANTSTDMVPATVVYAAETGFVPNQDGPAYNRFLVTASTLSFPILSESRAGVLCDPNPHVETWKLPTVTHVTWKAPDGTEVGGVLELPYGYQKGDKLPLVVAIHGGPTSSTKADLEFDPHNGRLYFAAAGYAVLLPNYRGSTGYGDKFVTDLIGHENDIEVKDILAGIQHLVSEGIADPERVGVMGWSNGGFLTNCLITLKDSPIKFKAASSGAGILDTVAEWGFNDEPAYPKVLKGGLPWEKPDIYRRSSPTYGLGNVTTPTLVHVGGADDRCPPGHSKMLFRALNEYIKVPTELVVYPGEPHGLTKMSHRRAKMEWDLAWFNRYLKK
jgi:dipeptidyl aminopeptidase/acylaminoacyl peptidase